MTPYQSVTANGDYLVPNQEIMGLQGAGTHTYSFDLKGMPRGVYVVKVSTDAYREARPITIMR